MGIYKHDELRMERIRAYFLSDEESDHKLSDADREILDRWKRADFLFNKYKNRRQVVNWLAKEFGVGKRTAYQDIINAMEFFSGLRSIDKNYLRAINIEDLYKDIEQARLDRDWRSVAALTKMLNEMIKDFENPEVEVRQPRTILIGNFRELLPYAIPDNFDRELEKLKVKKGLNFIADDDAAQLPADEEGLL